MTLQDLTGQNLGQYELRELMGVGGMGAVYRAHQKSLERSVALKVLSTALAAESGYIERFYREAKTAAALEHAHIVPVHDYGIQRDISYVVMRLLTGGTLAERMQRRAAVDHPLPSLGEVSTLLRQMAGALDYAHSQHVIHRDIKPSNVMFDNQGNAYLVDFGIAKLLSATSALTGTGTTMGTPAYMPPEQWRSEDLTPGADQYALGVTIYQLLVGRVPYEATTPFGLMHKHLNEQPTPLHTQRADLPEELTLVLERALAKTPGERFPTVTAFSQAFDRAISGSTGQQTGFFTMSLPRKTAEQTPARVSVPSSASAETTVEPTFGSAATPPPTPRAVTPPSGRAGEPSMVVQVKPPRRGPGAVVWVLGAALLVALAAIGVLVLGGQGGDDETQVPVTTPAEGPVISATPETALSPEPTSGPAIAIVPTDTAVPPSETPEPTETPIPPTDIPEPTDTAVPPSSTSEPTDTPVPPSDTPPPTDTPIPASDTPEPTHTAVPPTPVMVEPIEPGREVVIGPAGAMVRVQPRLDAEVIALPANMRLPLTGATPDGRWYRVEWEGREGFILASAGVRIEPVGSAQAGPPVLVIGPAGARVRTRPSAAADVMAVIVNTTVPIVGRTANDAWVLISGGTREGWVRLVTSLRVEGDLQAAPVIEFPGGAAAVAVISASGANVRTAPDFDAEVLTVAVNIRLPIVARTEDNNWLQVEWEGRTGWVRRSSGVQVEGNLESVPVVQVEPPAPEAVMVVIGPAGANVRIAPDVNAEVITVAVDVHLPVLGRTEDDNWLQVLWQERMGWVRRSSGVQVEGNLDAVPVIQVEPPAPEPVIVVIGPAGANVRVAPEVNAEVITVAVDVHLPILARTADDNWLQVEWEGRIGWVRRSSVVQVEGDLDTVPVAGHEAPPERLQFHDFESDDSRSAWDSWAGSITVVPYEEQHVLRIEAYDDWAGAMPIENVEGDYAVSLRARILRGPDENPFPEFVINVREDQFGEASCGASREGLIDLGYSDNPNRTWYPLESGSAAITRDEWFVMRVEVFGSEIYCFINDELIASGTLPGSRQGGYSLVAAPGSEVLFDDVTVVRME